MNAVQETKTKEIFRRLAEEIVLHPEQLKISETVTPRTIEISCRPSAGDFGKLLGKGGGMWRGLVHIAQLIGERGGARVVLALEDATEGDRNELYPPFVVNDDWDESGIWRLMTDTARGVYGASAKAEIVNVSRSLTNIRVHCAEGESLGKIVLIDRSLVAIFTAIGLQQGRVFTVATIDDIKPEGKNVFRI